MKENEGYILVLLVFAIMVFTVLGAAALTISLSDLRTSAHWAEADVAYYYAEAGVEKAVSLLPVEPERLGVFRADFTRAGVPAFTVTVEPVTAGGAEAAPAVRILSVGKSGSKQRTADVIARWRPLGWNALVGEEISLCNVETVGHVTGDSLVFGGGVNRVAGNITSCSTEGDVVCEGKQTHREEFARVSLDFAALAERALAEGWFTPGARDVVYVLEGVSGANRMYLPGDAVFMPGFSCSGLIVCRGDVTVEGPLLSGKMTVLAEGDITIRSSLLMTASFDGSFFLYSGGCLRREGGRLLGLNGVLMGRELTLMNMSVRYCDRAVLACLDGLPESLWRYSPSFDLEWVEAVQRR